MLLDENDCEYRMSEIRNEGIAPELTTITSSNVVSYVDFVRNHMEGLIADRKSEVKGILDSERWHRPYAEALMETEPAKQTALIAEAERAIFDRYLELRITPAAAEHSIDLKNAASYLSQLKKATGST
jgi:hypothetical protein